MWNMARAVFQSGLPTPYDEPSRVGCGTPCSDKASSIRLPAQLIINGAAILTLVVEICVDGIIHRRVLIVLAPVVVAHRRKE